MVVIFTECVRNPMKYFYYGTDMRHINDILSKFCSNSLPSYPFSSVFRHKIYLRWLRRIRVVKPLNYLPFIKSHAIDTLSSLYGWKPYPKNILNRFTRFYEGYWLPQRFGFDPRRVQFPSLILTGQMTRDDALESPSLLDSSTVDHEFNYVASKLEISSDQLYSYLNLPLKYYWDYKNQKQIFNLGARVLKAFGFEASIKK